MKKILLLSTIAGVAASVAAVTPAMAQTAPITTNTTTPGTITVSATTLPLCTAPGNLTVPLGQYNGTTTVTSTNNILFKCTNGTVGTVALTSASTSSNTSGNLVAPGSTTPIAYTFTGNGGSGVGTGLTASASNISIPSVITVAPGQNPTPGSYLDTIAVTVSY